MTTPTAKGSKMGDGAESNLLTSYAIDSNASGGRRSRRHNRRTSMRLILAIALAMTLSLLFLASIYYFTELTRLSTLNESLRVALEKDEQELAELRPAYAKAKGELEAMVKGRFPNLYNLEPDKVLPVNQGYVKNIVFSMVRQGQTKKYEYKLVMENNSGYEVRPDFKIVVFDSNGIQIGSDEVSPANLTPGEVRSYSSALSLSLEGEPQYFFLNWTGSAPRRQGHMQRGSRQ